MIVFDNFSQKVLPSVFSSLNQYRIRTILYSWVEEKGMVRVCLSGKLQCFTIRALTGTDGKFQILCEKYAIVNAHSTLRDTPVHDIIIFM